MPNRVSDRGGDSDWDMNAPVFDPEWTGAGLPAIWVTFQEEAPANGRTGRIRWCRYPEEPVEEGPAGTAVDQLFDGADLDEGGNLALHYGSQYYDEGMSLQDPELRQSRVDCFRAAELLYLWAASKGSVHALANLGYVYSYDRCEGQYLGLDELGRRVCEPDEAFPLDRRAFECYQQAADLGHPEACYKLGDMMHDGRGCEPSLGGAAELWERGYRQAIHWNVPVWWGSAALRLGGAFEEGEGCEQSFSQALTWYERAETGLRIAVDQGDWYYRKALRNASEGVVRCRQELSGQY